MITFPLILSAIMGFSIAELLAGKAAGHPGKWWSSIRIRVKEYTFHVHHWLYASVALVALPSSTDHKNVIEAFLLGIVVHGLTYSDFYRIVYREPAKNPSQN